MASEVHVQQQAEEKPKSSVSGRGKSRQLSTYNRSRHRTFLVRKSKGNIPSRLAHPNREAARLSVISDQQAQVNEGFMKVAKHAFA